MVKRKARLQISIDRSLLADIEAFSIKAEISKSDIIESLLALIFKTNLIEQLYSTGSIALTFSALLRVSAKVQAEKIAEMKKTRRSK